jgi:hypothetical protein
MRGRGRFSFRLTSLVAASVATGLLAAGPLGASAATSLRAGSPPLSVRTPHPMSGLGKTLTEQWNGSG